MPQRDDWKRHSEQEEPYLCQPGLSMVRLPTCLFSQLWNCVLPTRDAERCNFRSRCGLVEKSRIRSCKRVLVSSSSAAWLLGSPGSEKDSSSSPHIMSCCTVATRNVKLSRSGKKNSFTLGPDGYQGLSNFMNFRMIWWSENNVRWVNDPGEIADS